MTPKQNAERISEIYKDLAGKYIQDFVEEVDNYHTIDRSENADNRRTYWLETLKEFKIL